MNLFTQDEMKALLDIIEKIPNRRGHLKSAHTKLQRIYQLRTVHRRMGEKGELADRTGRMAFPSKW